MTHKLEKNKNMATKDVTVGRVNKKGNQFFSDKKNICLNVRFICIEAPSTLS